MSKINLCVVEKRKEFSTGEIQRVAIGRALTNSPSLILVDEPTGELDSETGFEIIKLLSDMCRKQKEAVIVAAHDEEIVEFAGAICRIRDGSIVQE